MEITLHRPGPWLSDCIAMMVHFSGFSPAHRREKLLPDGQMELVIDLTDRPKRLFDDETGLSGRDFRRAWLSGVHRRPVVIEAQPGSEMLVIAFTPGGAFPFFGVEAGDLAGQVVELEAIVGGAAGSLRDRVLEAVGLDAIFASAEAWLLERSRGPARRNRLLTHLVRQIEAGAGPIGALVAETGRSERHIQTLSQRWLGTSLKSYARLRRFQRVLRDIRPDVEPDWADLASAAGYFDQPHLYHDFLDYSGMTPGVFAAAHAGITDFLPLPAPETADLYKTAGPP